MPVPIPIPSVCPACGVNVPATGTSSDKPAIFVFRVDRSWFRGKHVKFDVQATAPVNVGIYGPNPTQIGPPFGRTRSPKIELGDAAVSSCEGNLDPGIYYLVVRSGSDGGPAGDFKVNLTFTAWKLW